MSRFIKEINTGSSRSVFQIGMKKKGWDVELPDHRGKSAGSRQGAMAASVSVRVDVLEFLSTEWVSEYQSLENLPSSTQNQANALSFRCSFLTRDFYTVLNYVKCRGWGLGRHIPLQNSSRLFHLHYPPGELAEVPE
jgi:hypothetical protein